MVGSARIFLRHFFFILLVAPIFLSCTKSSPQALPAQSDGRLEIEGLSFEKTIPLKYAKEFRIDVYNMNADKTDFTDAFGGVTGAVAPVEGVVENAEGVWSEGETSPSSEKKFFLLTISETDRYLVVPQNFFAPEHDSIPKNSAVLQNLPSDIKIIRQNPENVYLAASSVMSLWVRLSALENIKFSAIQKKDYYIGETVRAMDEEKILYAGKYNAPDFELLLNGKCSLAIESMMISHSPQIKEKLESLGIPVFVDRSSYEEHPLGRMEWIVLYGVLLGKAREAETFFNAQVQKIDSLLSEKTAAQKSPKKVAFFYITPNGLVVIRGSGDYIAKMIEMAGGAYAFPSTRKSDSPSVTISMEQFYAQCANADILIYNASIDNSVRTKRDLLQKSPLLKEFTAVQNGSVWVTGKYVYQATDRIGDMILDLNAIITERGENLSFLQKVDD